MDETRDKSINRDNIIAASAERASLWYNPTQEGAKATAFYPQGQFHGNPVDLNATAEKTEKNAFLTQFRRKSAEQLLKTIEGTKTPEAPENENYFVGGRQTVNSLFSSDFPITAQADSDAEGRRTGGSLRRIKDVFDDTFAKWVNQFGNATVEHLYTAGMNAMTVATGARELFGGKKNKFFLLDEAIRQKLGLPEVPEKVSDISYDEARQLFGPSLTSEAYEQIKKDDLNYLNKMMLFSKRAEDYMHMLADDVSSTFGTDQLFRDNSVAHMIIDGSLSLVESGAFMGARLATPKNAMNMLTLLRTPPALATLYFATQTALDTYRHEIDKHTEFANPLDKSKFNIAMTSAATGIVSGILEETTSRLLNQAFYSVKIASRKSKNIMEYVANKFRADGSKSMYGYIDGVERAFQRGGTQLTPIRDMFAEGATEAAQEVAEYATEHTLRDLETYGMTSDDEMDMPQLLGQAAIAFGFGFAGQGVFTALGAYHNSDFRKKIKSILTKNIEQVEDPAIGNSFMQYLDEAMTMEILSTRNEVSKMADETDGMFSDEGDKEMALQVANIIFENSDEQTAQAQEEENAMRNEFAAAEREPFTDKSTIEMTLPDEYVKPTGANAVEDMTVAKAVEALTGANIKQIQKDIINNKRRRMLDIKTEAQFDVYRAENVASRIENDGAIKAGCDTFFKTVEYAANITNGNEPMFSDNVMQGTMSAIGMPVRGEDGKFAFTEKQKQDFLNKYESWRRSPRKYKSQNRAAEIQAFRFMRRVAGENISALHETGVLTDREALAAYDDFFGVGISEFVDTVERTQYDINALREAIDTLKKGTPLNSSQSKLLLDIARAAQAHDTYALQDTKAMREYLNLRRKKAKELGGSEEKKGTRDKLLDLAADLEEMGAITTEQAFKVADEIGTAKNISEASGRIKQNIQEIVQSNALDKTFSEYSDLLDIINYFKQNVKPSDVNIILKNAQNATQQGFTVLDSEQVSTVAEVLNNALETLRKVNKKDVAETRKHVNSLYQTALELVSVAEKNDVNADILKATLKTFDTETKDLGKLKDIERHLTTHITEIADTLLEGFAKKAAFAYDDTQRAVVNIGNVLNDVQVLITRYGGSTGKNTPELMKTLVAHVLNRRNNGLNNIMRSYDALLSKKKKISGKENVISGKSVDSDIEAFNRTTLFLTNKIEKILTRSNTENIVEDLREALYEFQDALDNVFSYVAMSKTNRRVNLINKSAGKEAYANDTVNSVINAVSEKIKEPILQLKAIHNETLEKERKAAKEEAKKQREETAEKAELTKEQKEAKKKEKEAKEKEKAAREQRYYNDILKFADSGKEQLKVMMFPSTEEGKFVSYEELPSYLKEYIDVMTEYYPYAITNRRPDAETAEMFFEKIQSLSEAFANNTFGIWEAKAQQHERELADTAKSVLAANNIIKKDNSYKVAEDASYTTRITTNAFNKIRGIIKNKTGKTVDESAFKRLQTFMLNSLGDITTYQQFMLGAKNAEKFNFKMLNVERSSLENSYRKAVETEYEAMPDKDNNNKTYNDYVADATNAVLLETKEQVAKIKDVKNGDNLVGLTRAEALYLYSLSLNPTGRDRLVNSYGNGIIDYLNNSLTSFDKSFALKMAELREGMFTNLNAVYKRINGKSLKREALYTPLRYRKVAKSEEDMSIYTDISKYKDPSHIKETERQKGWMRERIQGDIKTELIIDKANIFEIHSKVMRDSATYIKMEEPVCNLIQMLFVDKRKIQGSEKPITLSEILEKQWGKTATENLLTLLNFNRGVVPQRTPLSGIESVLTEAVRRAAVVKVVTPAVGLRQISSVTLMLDEVPLDFKVTNAVPALVARNAMFEKYPELKERFEGQYPDAYLKEAFAFETAITGRRNHEFINKIMIINRFMDSVSCTTGAYIYSKYLESQTDSMGNRLYNDKQIREKVLTKVISTQQSSNASELSVGQIRGKGLWKTALYMFRSQDMQMARTAMCMMSKWAAGDLPTEALAKTLIAIISNIVLYQALMKPERTFNALFSSETYDRERVYKDLMRPIITGAFRSSAPMEWATGMVADLAVRGFTEQKVDVVDNSVAQPFWFAEEMARGFNTAIKEYEQDKEWWALFSASCAALPLFTAVPTNYINKFAKGIYDIYNGETAMGVMKVLGFTNDEAKAWMRKPENMYKSKDVEMYYNMFMRERNDRGK